MAGPRFGKRRWRRPERLTLDHGPLVRRKDLGVSEPLPLETELGRKMSRRQIQLLLLSFAVLSALEGFVIGLAVGLEGVIALGGLVFGLVYFIVAREFGDAWIVKALRATPSQGPRVTRLATAEARSAGIPAPRVLNAPGDSPNAVAFALRRRYLVTTQATEELDELELEGMIAHEIIHLRDGDASVASLFSVLAGGPDLVFRGAGVLALLSIPLWPVAMILRLARSRIATRDREHRADVAAAMLTRYPPGVAAALETAGGGTAGFRMLDPFWFVPRDRGRGEAEIRASLVSEM